jgi:two-component system, cell cycle sensor histidine kinase and response regulator CckA
MRAIEILLVEDSPTDRLIAVEALAHSMILNSLNVVENGTDAMCYLRRQAQYAEARRPDIILLDLNLPGKDGREVLTEIKADPVLRFIPVVVLTTSQSEEDLVGAYGSHANGYITKPLDFQQFTQALRALGGYWFEVVTLPPEAAIQRLATQAPLGTPPPPNPLEQAVRVLLIANNAADVSQFRDAITTNGLVQFQLQHATCLAEARSLLRSEAFDLVVTDLQLPDEQGSETYRRVRALAAGVPIIVLTEPSDEATGIRLLRQGAQDYLVKEQLTGRGIARAARYAIDTKRHQEQLRQAQRLEALGRLAAGVAHDFNNILAVIRGNAELLPSAVNFAEVAESAKEIEQASDRATDLARQLLSFSRKQAMHPGALDLNQVIGQFTKMLRRILGEGVHLELHLSAALPSIHADAGMLEQVLLNLAVNARDAMAGSGKFSIRTTSVEIEPNPTLPAEAYAGRFVRLSVVDTGAGIAPDVIDRIFEPFFTTKALGEGTGLGLSTVYAIVQQHRGWLNVSSRVGVGTTFEIFIPCTDHPPESTVPSAAAEVLGGEETILVVEDERVLRQIVTKLLRKKGYRVFEATSATEALGIWSAHQSDIELIFSDLAMARHPSGRTLTEQVRARNDLPIIFTSGYSPDAGGLRLDQGVNFLSKPYELRQLVQTVREQLDAVHLRRAKT